MSLTILKTKDVTMFYALSWSVVTGLFVLWSLAAWVFHSIAAWTAANVGGLVGGAGSMEALQLPAWLAPWVPGEYVSSLNEMISFLMPAVQTALEWAPSMASGLSIAVWTVWGIGTVVLVVLGFVATGVIAFLRRRMPLRSTFPQNLPAKR